MDALFQVSTETEHFCTVARLVLDLWLFLKLRHTNILIRKTFYLFATKVIINPNFEVAESDFTNNGVRCNCKYDGNRIWLHKCHFGKFGGPLLCGLTVGGGAGE